MDRRKWLTGGTTFAAGALLAGGTRSFDIQEATGLRTAESFGAVGDGRADDTVALLRAIDWERTTPGRALVTLAAGRTYRVRQTLRFDFDHGGLLCLDGAATVRFDMAEGNGIEVVDRASDTAQVSGSWFRGIHVSRRGRSEGHAWYYRRARFGHLNEDCGVDGGWEHCFHYDNSCYGNNALFRPHLEMGSMAGVGIWIGPVCNGLHVHHPEINNARIGAIEVDATSTSDLGEGPGVNSIILDHPMTHGAGEWHIRLNGAYASRITAPRLEAGRSAAPQLVIGDRMRCTGIVVDSAWFQGSRTASAALDVGRVIGLTVLEPAFQNVDGAAIRLRPEDAGTREGVLIVHPIRGGTTGALFAGGDARGATVLSRSGDVVPAPGAGLVLRDQDSGDLFRLVVRRGQLEVVRSTDQVL